MRGTEPTDEELLRTARSDPRAFEELYRRHVGKVVSFAARRCATPSEVPDLVGAVWLEVIASAETFDPRRGRAVPWLLGIAANLSASEARRRAREREAAGRLGGQKVLDEEDHARLEQAIDAAAVGSHLRDALAMLPQGQRSLVELLALDGLTLREAAEALGILPTAARMRLTRARRQLRGLLSARSIEPSQFPDFEEVVP